MTLNDIASLTAAVAALFSSLASVVSVIVTAHNSRKIHEIHISTNSMREELVRTHGDLRYAEGVRDGKDQK